MTKSEWLKSASLLALAYPNQFKTEDRDLNDFWFMMLEEYDGERVYAAVKRLIREKSAFPAVADLINFLDEKTDYEKVFKLFSERASRWRDGSIYRGGLVITKPILGSILSRLEPFSTEINHMTDENQGYVKHRFIENLKSLMNTVQSTDLETEINDLEKAIYGTTPPPAQLTDNWSEQNKISASDLNSQQLKRIEDVVIEPVSRDKIRAYLLSAGIDLSKNNKTTEQKDDPNISF